MSDTQDLSLLGQGKTKYPEKPEDAVLETFENQHQDRTYLVGFICEEFTSLCPKTGQPDFARLYILYSPRIKMIESKALKLYLFAFRNQGEFHEDVVNRIHKDLWEAMDPKYLRVIGDFNVRGGISIKPFVEMYQDTGPSNRITEPLIENAEIRKQVEGYDRQRFVN